MVVLPITVGDPLESVEVSIGIEVDLGIVSWKVDISKIS